MVWRVCWPILTRHQSRGLREWCRAIPTKFPSPTNRDRSRSMAHLPPPKGQRSEQIKQFILLKKYIAMKLLKKHMVLEGFYSLERWLPTSPGRRGKLRRSGWPASTIWAIYVAPFSVASTIILFLFFTETDDEQSTKKKWWQSSASSAKNAWSILKHIHVDNGKFLSKITNQINIRIEFVENRWKNYTGI